MYKYTVWRWSVTTCYFLDKEKGQLFVSDKSGAVFSLSLNNHMVREGGREREGGGGEEGNWIIIFFYFSIVAACLIGVC